MSAVSPMQGAVVRFSVRGRQLSTLPKPSRLQSKACGDAHVPGDGLHVRYSSREGEGVPHTTANVPSPLAVVQHVASGSRPIPPCFSALPPSVPCRSGPSDVSSSALQKLTGSWFPKIICFLHFIFSFPVEHWCTDHSCLLTFLSHFLFVEISSLLFFAII